MVQQAVLACQQSIFQKTAKSAHSKALPIRVCGISIFSLQALHLFTIATNIKKILSLAQESVAIADVTW